MSDSQAATGSPAGREEMRSALFAHLVMQQANLALVLLGKVPHPETGQVIRDLESAKLFVDLLEMIEAKTKGNLTREEQALLNQNLMAVRLAFVETVDAPDPGPNATPAPLPQEPAPAKPEPAPPLAVPADSAEEHRTKFTKKY